MVVANIYLMDMHKKKCSEFCDADQISSVLSETQSCSKSSTMFLYFRKKSAFLHKMILEKMKCLR